MEVKAGDDMQRFQAGDQHRFDELVGRMAGKSAGKFLLGDRIETQCGQKPGFDRRRGQAENRVVRGENRARMGLEGEDERRLD